MILLFAMIEHYTWMKMTRLQKLMQSPDFWMGKQCIKKSRLLISGRKEIFFLAVATQLIIMSWLKMLSLPLWLT